MALKSDSIITMTRHTSAFTSAGAVLSRSDLVGQVRDVQFRKHRNTKVGFITPGFGSINFPSEVTG